ERRHADDAALLLGHAHQEVGVGEGLAVGLRETDRLRVVADVLEQGQDGDAVLKSRRPNVNAHRAPSVARGPRAAYSPRHVPSISHCSQPQSLSLLTAI